MNRKVVFSYGCILIAAALWGGIGISVRYISGFGHYQYTECLCAHFCHDAVSVFVSCLYRPDKVENTSV